MNKKMREALIDAAMGLAFVIVVVGVIVVVPNLAVAFFGL